MNAFFPPLGKLAAYLVPGGGTPNLVRPDPTVYDQNIVETDKRRYFIRLHCPGTLRITFKDPADPDFTPQNWITVNSGAGYSDGYDLWYTGDVWVDGLEDVHVVSGY